MTSSNTLVVEDVHFLKIKPKYKTNKKSYLRMLSKLPPEGSKALFNNSVKCRNIRGSSGLKVFFSHQDRGF